MNLNQHENRNDMTVCLSQNEVAQLLEAADDTQQRIAFTLGADVASARTKPTTYGFKYM